MFKKSNYTAVHVRPANLADRDILADVHKRAWVESYSQILPASIFSSRNIDFYTKLWDSILRKPRLDELTLVATLEKAPQEIIGLCSYGPNRDPTLVQRGFIGEIYALYLLKAWQGHGIGRQIWEEANSLLLATKMNNFGLWVLEENKKAIAFYQAAGGTKFETKKIEISGIEKNEEWWGWHWS